MQNIAALLGYSGVKFNSTTRQFQPVNNGSSYLNKNRLHINKILPTVQNRLSRLCKNAPRYDVPPDGNDTEAKEDARYSLEVLQAMWPKLRLEEKRIMLYMWVQECGHAYKKIVWDPTDGKYMSDPLSGQSGFEGDVRAEVVSAFEVFPDPMAKSFDDVLKSWLIQCKVRKLDYFREQYPDKGDKVKEEGVWLLSAQYESRINSINTRGPAQSGMNDQVKGCAIEMIKYEAPSPKHPRGRMIVGANGILLADKELPYGEIPFAKFDDILVGGKYYSESIITHLRPVQDQYNETIRRRAEWTKKTLAGKYITFTGSGLKSEAMNDESGEMVEVTPQLGLPNAGAPIPLQIPSMPQWAYNETQNLDQEFNQISGISEVSQGNLPSASIPAVGMQLLVEQDATRLGITTEQHEHAWARTGMLILKCVQQNYVLPRKLKIAGQGLKYAVKDVKGDEIKNTDVVVVRGSTQPTSKVLKRQEILNTWQQGLLGDPVDPKVREKVLGLIEFGDTGGLWEDYGLDMSQIKRGFEKMKAGEAPPVFGEVTVDPMTGQAQPNPSIVEHDDVSVMLTDNHKMWILEIDRYRKGDEFESMDPSTQQLFLDVQQAHLMAELQLRNALPPSPQDQMDQELSQPAPLGAPPAPQGAA